MPEEIRAEVLARLAAKRWGRYPEFGAPRVKRAIADAIGRRPEEIVVGNGSGEVILAAVSVFAGGGTLVLATPTFSLYGQIAAIAAARVADVPRTGADFALAENEFLAASRQPGAVPLVCSPNNPTGGVVEREFLERLLDDARVVLLDQAYVDFAEAGDDALPLVGPRANLVVFRTLSKAYAAAGFRIGYAVAEPGARPRDREGHPAFQRRPRGRGAGHRRPLPSGDLARAREEDRGRARTSRRGSSRRGRRRRAVPFELPLRAPPGADAARVRRGLLDRGILVRDMTSAAPGRLRVSIGSRAENDLFLESFLEVI